MTPEDLRYSKEHDWVRMDGDDHVKIGITDYAQGELGDIVFVELPTVGTSLEVGQPFATIEAVKTVTDLNSPITGEVVEINEALTNDPSDQPIPVRRRVVHPGPRGERLGAGCPPERD